MLNKVLIIVLFLCLWVNLYSATYTVGHSHEFDFQTIQSAINYASNGDTIIVSPGIYYENLSIISKSLYLGSLFTTTADTTYIRQTIIDGQRLSSVAEIINAQNTTIEGFTIRNGFKRVIPTDPNSGGGGGIYVTTSTNISINNNIIHNNIVSAIGGGIVIHLSSANLNGNIIYRNMSMGRAGGIAIVYNSVSTSLPITLGEDVNINHIYFNTARFYNDIILNNTSLQNFYLGTGTFDYVSSWNMFSNTPTEFFIENGYVTEIDADLYVSTDGDDNNDGLTPFTALKTITMAMAKIVANPDNINTIHIADGVHNMDVGNLFPLHLKPQIKFIGESMDNTIIDVGGYSWGLCSGMYAWHDVPSDLPENITIKNITITNVFAQPGFQWEENAIITYALSNYSVYHIENVRYDDRNTSNTAQAGIAIGASESVLLKNIEIYRNSGTLYEYTKFAIHIYATLNANLENIIIDGGNHGIRFGYLREFTGLNEVCNATLSNVLIKNLHTKAFHDGAFYRDTANVIFINGSTRATDPLFNVKVVNSTFVNNLHDYWPFAAENRVNLEFYNSIFYDNEPVNRVRLHGPSVSLGGTSVFSHNLFEDISQSIHIFPANNWTVEYDNNLDGIPSFLGNGNHPEMLKHNSIGIGSGTLDIPNYTFPEFDLAGNPRITNGEISIGAYEYHDVGLFADFTADVTKGYAPMAVQFIDLSIGEIDSWAWDFDNDGVIDSNEQNPVYIYTEAGIYSVKLMINDGEESIEKNDFIVVERYVNADFTAEPLIGIAPLEVQFTDLSIGAVSWVWDFGVASTSSSQTRTSGISIVRNTNSTEQNPIFIFDEEGAYTITLTINDGESSITKPDFILVVPPVYADFSAEPLSGHAPLEVRFTDRSFGAFSWTWDFTGDENIDSTEQNPVFIFEEKGVYTVTLTINDGESSITKPDFILVVPPVYADFNAEPLSGHAPLEVRFTDRSFGAFFWAWDFTGDGIIDSTEQNPVFIFEEKGVYTVTLTINDGESSNTKPDFIVVTQPVKADFTAEPTMGTAPLEVHFTCISTGAMSWAWDFTGDGIIDSTERNPVFTYLFTGVYDVTLTINGGEDSITKSAFIDVTVDDIDDTEIPLTTQLIGNYPNPFNPETTIYFDLASDSMVSIEIFNIRGQRIRVLTNNHFYAGKHSVVWNGTDDSDKPVSSGIYFQRMVTKGFIETKRMALMK
ncbi:MAG: PKD domain-containing protein [Candidatus Cloacimonetes bacterium]|nr:PKD domain-containing protein [Candidatus Cloacimonadota bacterium]